MSRRIGYVRCGQQPRARDQVRRALVLWCIIIGGSRHRPQPAHERRIRRHREAALDCRRWRSVGDGRQGSGKARAGDGWRDSKPYRYMTA
jgi:hypothetical protein